MLLYAVRYPLNSFGSHQVTYSAVYYLSHIPGIENILKTTLDQNLLQERHIFGGNWN